ncbi:MAG: cobalamin-dependent protein [Fibrobacteria bacterium]|nr:cobalamin-dependent protein [Fibrobacteria bacterium]
MITEDIYSKYLEMLLQGSKKECTKITQDLLSQEIEIHDLYVHLFQASMYEVGKLWEENRISVAVEHMATAITEGLLHLVYPQIFAAEHTDKKAVISCVPNEYHQLGAKMVADIFELNAWNSYFLGANTPSSELIRMIDEKKPDILGLSMSLFFSLPHLTSMVEEVRSHYHDLEIVLGGQGFLWGGHDIVKKHNRLQIIGDLKTLESYIHTRTS